MFENINQIISYSNLTVGVMMSLIFLPKLIFSLLNVNSESRKDLYQAAVGMLNIRESIKLIGYVPILFYTSSICSTAVLLVFSKMILKNYIHFPSFIISLVIFFILGIAVRFMTLRTLNLEIKEDGDFDASNKLTHFNYFLMLVPSFIDTTAFREATSGIFGNMGSINNTIVSSLVIILIFIACMYLTKAIRYLSAGVLLMFGIVMATVIYSLDINHVIGLSNLPNNTYSLNSVIFSIIYANLFAIYSADLYCLCMERALVNYTRDQLLSENKIHKDQLYTFYLLSSCVIAFLSFIWLILFLNIGTTKVLINNIGGIAKILNWSVMIVFAIGAAMQSYVILDYLRARTGRIFALLLLLFANCFIWTDYLCSFTIFIFLIAQSLTAINLFLKLK